MVEVLSKSIRRHACRLPAVHFTYGERAPEKGKDWSKVTELVQGRPRPTRELAVLPPPPPGHTSVCTDNPSRPFPAPAPACSGLGILGRLLKQPSLVSPTGSKAGSSQWGASEGREGNPPSCPALPAPSLRGWLQRPQKQSRGPGLEHHLSARHGGGGLVSMATVQCEGILASLGRALSSINRGCSRLHAYYEQSQALSTGNYA